VCVEEEGGDGGGSSMYIAAAAHLSLDGEMKSLLV